MDQGTDHVRNSCVDGVDRRSALLVSSQLLGAVALMMSTAGTGLLAGCRNASSSVISAKDEKLLRVLADTVLPRTGTPGAGTEANIAFMLRAIDAGLFSLPRNILNDLSRRLDKAAQREFLSVPQAEQVKLIHAMDAQVLTHPEASKHPWFGVKALVLMAFYTSEAGMTQELSYDVVPGDFVPDITIDTHWRASSNDWAAVSVKKALHT